MKKKSYNFTYSLRVRYSEVDYQGIVFNAHYLTYFDCAITEYYRAIKYNYSEEVKKYKKDFHVVKTIIEYKKPILFDQIINIKVRVSKIGNTSLTYDISLYSEEDKDLLAEGSLIQVYTDQITVKSVELPIHLIKKIKNFESLS